MARGVGLREESDPSRFRDAMPQPIVLRLPYEPPFDWAAIVGFLSARAIQRVEAGDDTSFRRAIRIGDSSGVVTVRPIPGEHALRAELRLEGGATPSEIERRLRCIFDLDAEPRRLTTSLSRDPILRRRLRRFPGVRVPGAWSGFEMAVRAILGQQVSVRGATTLAGRLVERHGESLPGRFSASEPDRLFPRPERLANANLTEIGLTRARAHTVSSLAAAVVEGRLDLEKGGSTDTLARLRLFRGVGDWTAQYIGMRALRDADAFPAGDLGVRRALASGAELPSAADVERRAEKWRPFRAYAAMLLWLAP